MAKIDFYRPKIPKRQTMIKKNNEICVIFYFFCATHGERTTIKMSERVKTVFLTCSCAPFSAYVLLF